MLGKIESRKRRGQKRKRWLDSIIKPSEQEFEQTLGDDGGQRSLGFYSPWGCRVEHNLATEQQNKKFRQHI